MRTSDFDYNLPPELIAQVPLEKRTASRMMVLRRDGSSPEHKLVSDLPAYLRRHDLLVLNDTRVFPARIFGRWQDTAGRVELLLLEPAAAPAEWLTLYRGSRPPRPGLVMQLAEDHLQATVLNRDDDGHLTIRFHDISRLDATLDRFGVPPVPPYISRTSDDERVTLDRERYQTVYANQRGAVAAPTAGLHFSRELLDQLRAAGIDQTCLTLHVGPGTFKPVQVEQIEDHRMDPERYEISSVSAAAINETRRKGGRIVAVGSTSVRTLETVGAAHGGTVTPAHGRSSLFIHPPYDFRVVDVMLTNFHLPRSTLLMMVCAFAGYERVMAAYDEAVKQQYRFFSYGDCMLLL